MPFGLDRNGFIAIRGEDVVRSQLAGGINAAGDELDAQNAKIDHAVGTANDRCRSFLEERYERDRLGTLDMNNNPALKQTLCDFALTVILKNRGDGLSPDAEQLEKGALDHWENIAENREHLEFPDVKATDSARDRFLSTKTAADKKFGPGSGFMGWLR